jgi:hypothetical protein
MDVLDSRYVFEPFQKVEKALLKYDFIPMRQKQIVDLQKAFILGGSRIILPKHMNAEFLLTIMPKINGKPALNINLLYRHSSIEEKSSRTFHEHCDNKGATMTFVLANGGFIFGGYNPKSWVNEFSYSDAPDAYLFQVYSPLAELESNSFEDNLTLQRRLDMSIA